MTTEIDMQFGNAVRLKDLPRGDTFIRNNELFMVIKYINDRITVLRLSDGEEKIYYNDDMVTLVDIKIKVLR